MPRATFEYTNQLISPWPYFVGCGGRSSDLKELGISGGLVHAHTRDPRLTQLSNEALAELAQAYDGIIARHSVPALPAAQDAPVNQTVSTLVMEVVEGAE